MNKYILLISCISTYTLVGGGPIDYSKDNYVTRQVLAAPITQDTQVSIKLPQYNPNTGEGDNGALYSFMPTVGFRAQRLTTILLIPCSTGMCAKQQTGFDVMRFADGIVRSTNPDDKSDQSRLANTPANCVFYLGHLDDPGKATQQVTITNEGTVYIPSTEGGAQVPLPLGCSRDECKQAGVPEMTAARTTPTRQRQPTTTLVRRIKSRVQE